MIEVMDEKYKKELVTLAIVVDNIRIFKKPKIS